MRRVRVARLPPPPEMEDRNLKMALGAFGEIRDIQPEIWPYAYRHRVSNGVRVVSMLLVKHLYIMGIPYSEEIKILGVKMRNTMKQSALASWTRLAHLVRRLARGAHSRDLNIVQCITFVQVYMVAKLWYTAQVLQLPSENLRQIITPIAWYIWQGAFFRLPIPTLQRRKEDGGWDLIEVNIKCRALLITRIWLQGQQEGTMMKEWQRYWRLQGMRDNPHIRQIPPTLEYLPTQSRK